MDLHQEHMEHLEHMDSTTSLPLSSDNYMECQLMLLPLKESEEMRNATAVKLYQHGIFL
jgi:hypothetical protein